MLLVLALQKSSYSKKILSTVRGYYEELELNERNIARALNNIPSFWDAIVDAMHGTLMQRVYIRSNHTNNLLSIPK